MTLMWLGFAASPAVPVPAAIPDSSGHRHRNSAGTWVTVTGGRHRHADLDARIAALEAAVRALAP